MPMLMTNRSFINLYYVKENEDGSVEYLTSSRGTEELEKRHNKIIKKNVLANTLIEYRKVTPISADGSCELE